MLLAGFDGRRWRVDLDVIVGGAPRRWAENAKRARPVWIAPVSSCV
jgi:hypothetical protein